MSVLVSSIFLLLAPFAHANSPAEFSWVNLETDTTTMATVRHALHDKSITAIREVGVEDGFALVMTASRESDAPTPDYDRWTIYNVALRTGTSRVLVSGYGVKLLDWIGLKNSELAITYYDCWECEAATLFTTLRFKTGAGWRARWINKVHDANYPQPGGVVLMTDVGDPYDDNVVDQVFAVVKQPNDRFAVGNWTHTRNIKTGKIDDAVVRYSIDPTTDEDRVEELTGQVALSWERQICNPKNLVIQPSNGQDSKSCGRVLQAQTTKPAK
jgi:hypothetical protein